MSTKYRVQNPKNNEIVESFDFITDDALETALTDTEVAGTVTNIDFLIALTRHQGFREGRVDTGLIARDLPSLLDGGAEDRAALVLGVIGLAGLADPAPVARRTQWWLLALRLAAVAAVLVVPIQQAHYLMGGDALLLSFIVVIIGGLGSLRGTVLAALLIGLSDGIVSVFFSPTLAKILATLLVAMVLVFRPQGLFGTRTA